MENFLSQITLHFNDNPEKVIKNALRYYYKLDDMLFILYSYHFNLKDPFIENKYYLQGLKRQGIRHIINTLYTIYTMINKEENKTLSELVMSDYQIG
jgi:predicted acetyltransferase